MPQVIISGTGCVTCAGHSPNELFLSASTGQHGLTVDPDTGLTLGFIDQSKIPLLKQRINEHKFSQLLFPDGIPDARNKPLIYLYDCLLQAMRQAKWQDIPERTGFIFATTTGYVPYWEQDLVDFAASKIDENQFKKSFKDHPLSRPLDPLFRDHNRAKKRLVDGPLRIITSACAAGTQSLALAEQWIRTGKVDRCIVAGTELLSTLTIRGFNSLSLISKQPCAPFDQDRAGINLSEAAAVMILERSDLATNAEARLSGGGMSLDSYDMTSPDPSGSGIAKAINSALQTADLRPAAIDWIHTHGTGSQVNDLAEAAAAVQVFGAKTPPVSSTKGVHGHGLAVSGILESILCIEAMKQNTILGTLNHRTTDEKITANIQKENITQSFQHIMKTTLGFGGVNAAIVLSASAGTP